MSIADDDGPSMTTWIAFLRGMNLGGRRLTNDRLATAVLACGVHDVRTFLASGNVVLDADGSEDEVTHALQSGLADELGYRVATYLRSADEVRALVADPVFDEDEVAAAGTPQVAFLRCGLDAGTTAEVSALAPPDEQLVVRGRELHWLPRTGITDSDLDLSALDRLAGGHTMRTRNTVERLARKYLLGSG